MQQEIIPEQREGGSKDFSYSINTADEEQAKQLFSIARERMLSVNQWHSLAGILSATFQLTDPEGNELQQTIAKQGDYLKINIPGPGSIAGKGYDWVLVEQIQEEQAADSQFISMLLRPVSSPQEKQETDPAHFFDDKATSTFTISRTGSKLTALYHGRNETPNTDTDNLADKVRNALVALSALLGFSDLQWKSLIKGFLSF